MREKVYAAIKASPHGLTDEEIGRVLSMQGNSVRPRRVELVGDGARLPHRIESAGTRKTRSGRRAVVWVVVA